MCAYCCSESIGVDERLDETWVTVFGYVLRIDICADVSMNIFDS